MSTSSGIAVVLWGVVLFSTVGVFSQDLSPEEMERLQKDYDRYATGMTYIDGSPRERFTHPGREMFVDVPKEGTGTLILAYFGARRADLEKMVSGNKYVEVRAYAIGSNEHHHAQLFGASALGVDGLGRKITRYIMDPKNALKGLLDSEEVTLLKKYLHAKAILFEEDDSDED